MLLGVGQVVAVAEGCGVGVLVGVALGILVGFWLAVAVGDSAPGGSEIADYEGCAVGEKEGGMVVAVGEGERFSVTVGLTWPGSGRGVARLGGTPLATLGVQDGKIERRKMTR